MTETRIPSPVDAVADRHLDEHVALDPIEGTYLGIPGGDDRLPDFTPGWWAERSSQRRRTLAALEGADPVDDADKVTIAALRSVLELGEELHATGEDERRLDVIASPSQQVREVFDLMPTDTADDWAVIGRRLRAVPTAIDGYTASLRQAAARGDVAARRQVAAVAEQCAGHAAPDGFWATFASGAPDALRDDVVDAARDAAEAYDRLARTLREELLPAAPEEDAVGRDRYRLHSRTFLGAVIDLEETYAWGQEELARITADMAATAERIKPGLSVHEAIAYLDESEAHALHGTDELQRWMQQTSDEAIAELADVHFDIPEPIRRLECRIAPTQQGGIYYTGPSEDLVSRPGRMWWSVPKGVTEFSTWRERTTVYHEGVPGHHLQIAQTVYRREILNRWRRTASWISGHGEGWALYAERLMADLGYLDDPADHLGMLDGQSLRAARVVLDIGLHCGFDAPAEVGGGAWTYDKAWAFLTAHANMAEGFLRFELDRYLGWPGQAPSYKVGERLWLQLRDAARAQEGDAFDLRAFHRRALDIGSVGLDVMRAAVLGEL